MTEDEASAELASIVVRHGFRSRKFIPPPTNGLNVSVAVAVEHGLDLSDTLTLTKAALLYADHVTLYSIPAFVLDAARATKHMSHEQRSEFLRDILHLYEGPQYAEQLPMLDAFMKSIKGVHHLPPEQLVMREKYMRIWKTLNKGFTDSINRLFDQNLVKQLDEAISAGLVTIQPIGSGEFGSEVLYEYLSVLERITSEAATLPLLDSNSSDLLNEAFQFGMIQKPMALPGGQHPSLAADFINRLPAFNTEMDVLLDIRKELNPYIKPFRQAMIGYGKEMSSQPWEEGFEQEAELIYYEKVAPEVQKIDLALKSNSAIQRAVSVISTPHALTGSTLGIAMGHFLPVAAAVAAPILGAAAGGVKAYKDHKDEKNKVQSNQLFFYYKASKHIQP